MITNVLRINECNLVCNLEQGELYVQGMVTSWMYSRHMLCAKTKYWPVFDSAGPSPCI